ncbi:hypothetical protein G6F37_008779 [Rhizopus arrhizus]|jgi:hypothetical protein|nr:hypothetical protein G6F38_008871 [Rhizopus arrhizus]KAG1155178.1 hypothetical protein G6F37_008779 [Rhizopus arrhizus]
MSKPYYLRAKREKVLLFLCYQPNDSLEQLKTNLCEALNNNKTHEEVKLFIDGDKTGEYLPLESTKSIESGSTVYFVYFDRQEGQWEPVNVVQPQLDDDIEEEEPVPVVVKKEKGKKKA